MHFDLSVQHHLGVIHDTWVESIVLIVLARQDNCKPNSVGISGRKVLQVGKVKGFVFVFVFYVYLYFAS